MCLVRPGDDEVTRSNCCNQAITLTNRVQTLNAHFRQYPNSAPLDTGKTSHYGGAMADRQDTSRVAEPGYRLDARGRQQAEDDRLGLLEDIFDPLSRQRRELVQPGWRCLEIGAGRGSMAVWLAERVGESGQVVATDIDVTYLKRLNFPNL